MTSTPSDALGRRGAPAQRPAARGRALRRVFAAALAGAICLTAAGCSASTSRPDPTAIVTTYLDAIAEGDASTAAAMDPDTVVTDEDGDADVLRTDAVLGGALERISDVQIDAETGSDGADTDARRVTFSYELDGERVDSSLGVAWDDTAGDWHLTESMAGRIFAQVSTSRIDGESIGYSVPGATVEVADPPRLFQWAYPAVYEVRPAVDPSLLRDPDAVSQRVTVSPAADTTVDVAVTSLPEGEPQ